MHTYKGVHVPVCIYMFVYSLYTVHVNLYTTVLYHVITRFDQSVLVHVPVCIHVHTVHVNLYATVLYHVITRFDQSVLVHVHVQQLLTCRARFVVLV